MTYILLRQTAAARPPRVHKRQSEVWKGTEGGGVCTEGIDREEQAAFQFDKADMKR